MIARKPKSKVPCLNRHNVEQTDSTGHLGLESLRPKRRKISTERMGSNSVTEDICADGPLQEERLSTDVFPTSACSCLFQNEVEYRRKLKNVDEELVGRDIAGLKFLCHKIIPASKLENVRRGIDLFPELEIKQKLSINNADFLAECLYVMGRIDLLHKLGINVQQFEEELQTGGGDLSMYRKTLFHIGEGLTKKEVSTLKYLIAPQIGSSRRTKGSIASIFDLFVTLEHSELISDINIQFLVDKLTEIGQPTLAEIGQHFHRYLEGGDAEQPFINVNPPQAPALLRPSVLSSHNYLSNEGLGQPAPKSAWEDHNDNLSTIIPEVASGCPTRAPILPPQPPSEAPQLPLTSFLHGEEADNLPNIAVSSGEAQLHQTEPNTPAGASVDQGQNVITGDLRRLKLEDELHLPRYKMDAQPRGFCLVINNNKFYSIPGDEESKELKHRNGTDVDAYNLTYIFQKLNFIVERYNDLTDTEMVRKCTEFSMIDHRKFDCFVCCILTHGVKDHLYGCNGHLIPMTEVTSCFKAQRCPSLNGKPKLFFIQACQGKDRQGGLSEFQRDAPDERRETIPNEADFLLGYATVPGFVSYRSDIYGSWYITKLVEMLDKYADRYDLLSIMILVNEHVGKARSMEKGVAFKQSPAPLPTLRKKIYFN